MSVLALNAGGDISSLQPALISQAAGLSEEVRKGTGLAAPRGVEAILEYNGIYLNVVNWRDTFLIKSITGIDDADIRDTRQPNPGDHGETPFNAWYGGRTMVVAGKVIAGTMNRLRDMNQSFRSAFSDISTERALIFHGPDPARSVYILCKKNSPLQITEEQTTPNDFQRQFSLTLRASMPWFLSLVQYRLSVTGTASWITFTSTDVPIIEDFTSGVSSGYTQSGGDFYTTSGGLLVPTSGSTPVANFILNPKFAANTGSLGLGPDGAWGGTLYNESQVTGSAGQEIDDTGCLTWGRGKIDSVQAGQQQDDAYFGGAPVPNGNFATPGNYTVSAYYRTEAAPPADARFYIEILCYNSSNAYLSTVTSGDYSLTASWQRVIWFVTLPANTARVSVRFHYKRPRFSYWADGTWMNLSLTMLRSGWFYGRYADPDILQALPVKRYPSVEYHWGDTSKPNFSTTLGPLGQRNFVFDPSSRAGTYRTGLNATVAQVATGGADSDAFYRATYTGNSGQFASMGLYAKSWLNFPGDKHSFSAMARIPGGASRAVALEVDWYDKNDTLISWATSPDVVLGGDWTRVPLEGIYAPNNAYSVRIFVLVLNPQLGDMLDADMTFGTHSDTLPTYFDWRSPWAQPTNSANKDGGESILNSYKLYLTPRSYTDVWNAVKVKIPSSYPATTNDTDTMRLVMSYIDFDNQLFVGIESDGHAVITKRVRGVETRLVDSGNTFAWNAGQNYWLRGVLKQGKIICEIIQTNDITGLTAEYTVYGAWYYDLTSDEVAMFLTPASRIGLGIQFTAYGMAFDEWRYQSLAEPQGWKFYSGAGSVQVLNNTLRPLAPRPYLSGVQTPIPVVATLQGKTYNNPDLTAQIKQRIEIDPSYTNYTSGIVIKLLDKSNWIACYQSHFDGSNDVLNVDKCVNGVQSTLWSSSAMAMAKATNYWFRVTMTGNVIKIDRFVVDPGMGPATPQQTTTYTLTGADIAKFGTGVKGEFGIYWVPSMMQCSIDDFRFETGSYNTTAAAVKNAGNFPAQTRFELVGPMTNPVITNEATGQMAKINATIPAGETWVLEHKGYSKRLYRLSDGANRISYLDDTSQWIFISPNGVVNNIDLNASALSPGWDMVTYFQDTWM